MKSITLLSLNLSLIFILSSLNLFAQVLEAKDSLSQPQKDEQIQKIITDLKALDSSAIKEIEKAVAVKTQKSFDLKRSKTLGQILVNVRNVGGVRIKNCNDLDVLGDSPEVRALRVELLDYCQQSLGGFWAQLDANGILRFSYNMSNSNNSKTVNIGSGGEFSVSYRGHEILIRGNIDDNEVGKTDSQSFKRMLNSRVDYSVDLAIRNLEAFLMWHFDQEDAVTTNASGDTETGFQRQALSTGVRLEIVQKDFMDLKVGLGAGYGFRDAYGKEAMPYYATWSPSVIGTLDFTITPTELLSFVANGRVQRDFYTASPTWVLSQTLGAEFKVKGITIGTRFTLDWDEYREFAGVPSFGYSAMFTLGVHLEDLIGDKEQRAERRSALEREQSIWSAANELVDQEN